jgi:hypothetical protein
MMRKVLVAICLCFATPALANDGDLVDLGNGFAAEKVSSVDVDDIWRAADVSVLRSKSGLVVQFWPENEEFRERKGKWTAVGFVFSGVGDIGEVPVAIRLWSKSDVSYLPDQSKSYEKRKEKVALFFHKGCPTDAPCSPKILAVALRLEEGSQVFINNKQLGSIDLIP